jgi:hypothetical protein
MTREQALDMAIKHVEAMVTNARGYQDGVTLPQKVDAVERFAALLIAEADGELAKWAEGDPDLTVDFGEFWADGIEEGRLNRCHLCGAVVEGYSLHTDWHRGLGR